MRCSVFGTRVRFSSSRYVLGVALAFSRLGGPVMLKQLLESSVDAEVQKTTLALDVLGRYICNTYDEAVNNGGFPFDAIVLGAGMYGAYTAEKIFRGAKGGMRVLVLDAGTFLV